jgi:hypothetical protein
MIIPIALLIAAAAAHDTQGRSSLLRRGADQPRGRRDDPRRLLGALSPTEAGES